MGADETSRVRVFLVVAVGLVLATTAFVYGYEHFRRYVDASAVVIPARTSGSVREWGYKADINVHMGRPVTIQCTVSTQGDVQGFDSFVLTGVDGAQQHEGVLRWLRYPPEGGLSLGVLDATCEPV